jgi:hypothetical protein
MLQTNAMLAISSTDRYITSINGKQNQPFDNTVIAEYTNVLPFANDFSIESPAALMNGYIDRIIVSQIQLQYNLPTIQAGNNDNFVLYVESLPGSGIYVSVVLSFPYGFYNPTELAAMLEIQLNDRTIPDEFTVTYSQGDPNTIGTVNFPPNAYSFSGFLILSNRNRNIRLPKVDASGNELQIDPDLRYTNAQVTTTFKTYKLFGFSIINSVASQGQRSYNAPNFLYTPYIDIYSDALTNYQSLKDTDSSVSRRKGLVSRLYLANANSIQTTTPNGALGTAPFVACYDFNSPKVIGWSPDTAINSLDFQVRDCYGDLLFTNAVESFNSITYLTEIFNTEFQMTLLCIEG